MSDTIHLKEWDWDNQTYVEREYPLEYVKEFMDDLRLGKLWRENPDVVHAKLMKLERDLTEFRNTKATKDTRCTATTASGSRCRHDATQGGLCGIHANVALAVT